MSFGYGRLIIWDACCKRWRKDIDRGSWVQDDHEHRELNLEECEVYGNTVSPETELDGKYVVWSPESAQPPRVVYDNKPDAIKAAYAMAGKCPGSRFTVAKIEGVATVQAVRYLDFTSAKKGTRK